METISKLKRCEHCLAACKETDDECHYCGRPLNPWAYRPRPRTIGEELTFHRFNGVVKK